MKQSKERVEELKLLLNLKEGIIMTIAISNIVNCFLYYRYCEEDAVSIC